MWTKENRKTYDRTKRRYPSDLKDEEWALIQPLIPPAKRGGGKRTVDIRAVVNGVMYVLSTGCQWQYMPKDLPSKSTVFFYFKRWFEDGTLEKIHAALFSACRLKIGRDPEPTACVIDSQSVKWRKKGGVHRPAWLRCWQENQGEEEAYSRRHDGLTADRNCSRRRCSGS
jgi:transposase